MIISLGSVLTLLAIAIAVGLPGCGSSYGVGLVGQAGAGVVSEDPDKFGQILLLQIVPGTQGIYGVLAGLMIMLQAGFLSGAAVDIDPLKGWAYIAAALPIGLVGMVSAFFQGKVAASGVGILAKRPGEMGKAILFAAMVETYAILSLLVSLLLILRL
jgi:V/A-type H+-transporting ATPase subunit K